MEKKNQKTGDEVVGIRVQPQVDEPAHAEVNGCPRSAQLWKKMKAGAQRNRARLYRRIQLTP